MWGRSVLLTGRLSLILALRGGVEVLAMFRRAAAYLNLSPGERALLRLGEGMVISAVIAGAQAVFPYLSSSDPSTINWSSALHTFVTVAVGALGAAIVKYFKAQRDPALPAATGTAPSGASTPPGPALYVGGAQPPAGVSAVLVPDAGVATGS